VGWEFEGTFKVTEIQTGIEVEHLVRAQLAHFGDLIGSRVVMDGVPPLSVCPCQIPVD
jgi:hypothetical protein